jgi:hypothetical protein
MCDNGTQVRLRPVNRWYKLDENIVCPRPEGTRRNKGVYGLQSRAGVGNWADEVEGSFGR